ncbi:MAG: DUF3445 domain-containing protein [Acetobacteraceae bacterium]|nr:DUF3445 domain-containing protein [Acetobacteraceae bacterium]
MAGHLARCPEHLRPSGTAAYRWTAGLVCFPTRWRLSEKIGHVLASVHAPVPFYADRLAKPVHRFMRRVKPGHIATRLNWSVLDDATLFQPTGTNGGRRSAALPPPRTPAKHCCYVWSGKPCGACRGQALCCSASEYVCTRCGRGLA